MAKNSNIFLDKKILIYGLGKTGLSTYKFLKDKCDIYLFDDFFSKNNLPKNTSPSLKKKIIDYKKILNSEFDQIILSPGIDINKCKLSKLLIKNYKKIFTDLDIFYSFFKNDCITITGTNGKSTTCQLLYEILLKQKLDVKLVGNIGNPILNAKKIKKKTIFIVEASSFQLDYSKLFNSKYFAILNISPDHIERHKTIKNYINAKFKLLNNKTKRTLAFVNGNNLLIKKQLKTKKYNCRIKKIYTNKFEKYFKNINNNYFLTEANKENLSFVLEIVKKLNLKKNLIFKSIKKFKGLKYRQQIVYKKSQIIIINDSKSTSFSSSIGILKSNQNIFWLLGGIPKKGDKFILPKKYYHKIQAYIYGKNRIFFNRQLSNKIKCKYFKNLEQAFKKVLQTIKKQKTNNKTILFSPSAASFDSFKNFEERGLYFNKLIKKYLNAK